MKDYRLWGSRLGSPYFWKLLYDAWFFIGHRRYVKDGHWIRDAGFLIGER